MQRYTQSTKVRNNSKNFSEKKKRRISFLKIFKLILSLLFILAVTFMLIRILVSLYKHGSEKVKVGENVSSILNSSYISENNVLDYISRHIKLPEEPLNMVLKVKDSKVLENQSSVFKGVKNGDFVIIYPSLAIVYDASSDKILKTIALDNAKQK